MEPLEGGWSGETFLAEAGGDRTVVRIFAGLRHSPEAAQVQEALLTLVRGLLPVPEVLEVSEAVSDPADPAPPSRLKAWVSSFKGGAGPRPRTVFTRSRANSAGG